jgi:hypothetical protein
MMVWLADPGDEHLGDLWRWACSCGVTGEAQGAEAADTAARLHTHRDRRG